MSDQKRVVLITGVAGYWGMRVAAQLAGRPDFHVIGVDDEQPSKEIKDLDFIQADIRNPLLIDLLRLEQVDTICHLVFVDSHRPSEASFETNVMGTIKVFGAAAEAGVRKIIIKSSTAVYGARSTNPAFLVENHPLRGSRSYGYTRDGVEIEAFCNGFRRQHPHIDLTVLRFPNIIGPTVDTPMTRFLTQPGAPVLLGFDPMMQFIHEDDVVAALVHAIEHPVPGVFNVAAEGNLPLARVMGLAGKLTFPVVHLLAYWSQGILGRFAHRYLPIEPDYIRYRWVGDITRMREEMGFTPRYTAEEALREFAGKQRMRQYLPESAALAYDEERLRDTIERRRRARDLDAARQAQVFPPSSEEPAIETAAEAPAPAPRTRSRGKKS
jgi:UDP-glucose 4-epimerase